MSQLLLQPSANATGEWGWQASGEDALRSTDAVAAYARRAVDGSDAPAEPAAARTRERTTAR